MVSRGRGVEVDSPGRPAVNNAAVLKHRRRYLLPTKHAILQRETGGKGVTGFMGAEALCSIEHAVYASLLSLPPLSSPGLTIPPHITANPAYLPPKW